MDPQQQQQPHYVNGFQLDTLGSNPQLTMAPLEDWRLMQQEMLKQYLATAECDLKAKQELVDIKQQRLHLAQDEYNHLNSTLASLSASTTSRKSSLLYYLHSVTVS